MKTEVTRRSYDQNYVVWGYTVDPSYNPTEYNEDNIPYIPQRWIILGVYDERSKAYKKQQQLSGKK